MCDDVERIQLLGSCEHGGETSGSIEGVSFLPCERLLASLLEVTVSRTDVRARDEVPHPFTTEYCSNLSLMSLLPRTIQLFVLITGTRFCAGGAESSVVHGANARVRLCPVDKNMSPRGA